MTRFLNILTTWVLLAYLLRQWLSLTGQGPWDTLSQYVANNIAGVALVFKVGYWLFSMDQPRGPIHAANRFMSGVLAVMVFVVISLTRGEVNITNYNLFVTLLIGVIIAKIAMMSWTAFARDVRAGQNPGGRSQVTEQDIERST